jgi:hypothetical protein
MATLNLTAQVEIIPLIEQIDAMAYHMKSAPPNDEFAAFARPFGEIVADECIAHEIKTEGDKIVVTFHATGNLKKLIDGFNRIALGQETGA